MALTQVQDGMLGYDGGSFANRNRIINGDMRIDQRNAGSSVTNDSAAVKFAVDRTNIYGAVSSKFTAQQNAGSVTPPAGFINYLGCTSSSAYTVGSTENFWVQQRIEGLNVADLGWGTANAKTVTLSFWVRSSLTGTFGGSFQNSASNRSYPFAYTISSADTWEYKTVTIAGDTTGAWGTTTNVGIRIYFGIGVGPDRSGTAGAWAGADYRSATGATNIIATNGATFYITGVQLEVGETATPFERRPYGMELALCQRYFYNWVSSSGQTYSNLAHNIFNNQSYGCFVLPVLMRASPTLTTNGTASHYGSWQGGSQLTCSVVPGIDVGHPQTPFVYWTYSGTPLTVAGTTMCRITNTSAFLGFNAEL